MVSKRNLVIRVLVYGALGMVLVGCATAERQSAVTQCRIEARNTYPPVIESRTVNRTRAERVPTGVSNCEVVSEGGWGQPARGRCVQETTVRYIPYVAVENVDINKAPRDAATRSCADRICFQRYGNRECKTNR